MVTACGVVEACSPRAPKYSGKLIARAVELYRDGVKPGYMRWHELQARLEKEFPGEFKHLGQDKPSPETVLEWVRKYPDAPERLRQLRVQQAELSSWQSRPTSNTTAYQPVPVMSVSSIALANTWLSVFFQQLAAAMVFVLVVYFIRALSWD